MATSTLERPPAHIDPRFRARRIEVQRGAGRRRLQRLVDLGAVVAVVVAFALALRSPLLDVDAVVVSGSPHTPADAVVARAGIGRGDQLMDVDLRAVGERVTTLPWVAAVRVERGVDGEVALRVTERVPVAVVGEAADAALVDQDGQVLGPVTDAPDLAGALVRIVGLEPVPAGVRLDAGVEEALELATRLAEAAPGLAQELVVDDDLTLVLASGIAVRFGAPSQVDAKVRSLETVLAQVDLTCADVIDLRAPGSPVLTREEGCS